MYKIFGILISLAVLQKVNSLDAPRLYVYQDLVEFSSQIKEIIRGIEFMDPNLGEDNPIFKIVSIIDNLDVDTGGLRTISPSIDKAIIYLLAVYESFVEFAANISIFNEETLKEFIEIVTVEAPDHVTGNLEVLESDEVWENLIGQQLQAPENCGANFTQQMDMYRLYQQIMIIKLKTLVSFYGAYNFQKYFSENSTDESDQVEQIFTTASKKYIEQLKEIMANANREVYTCDSETHVPDQDYVEFDGLFSVIVVNEYEIKRRPSCGNGCSAVQATGTKRCAIDRYGEEVCPQHPCRGTIYDCGWVGGDIDVCELDESYRKRYEWVRSYGNNVWYGEWTRCDNGKYFEIRSPYYLLSACSTCVCKCSEEFPSSQAVRTLSLRPQMSNINKNKVVSSVRFVSQDDMIQIQIAEAPLLPLGRIDSNQSSWVPLDKFSYVTNNASASFVSSDGRRLRENKDFIFVNLDRRTLFMDQIVAGSEYVVTGVKFSLVKDEEEDSQSANAFQLEINITPFDFATGQLTSADQSQWITAEMQPNPPEIYSAERRQMTYGQKSYKYDPVVMHSTVAKPNRYLLFDSSSVHSDVGQSTIPFFDARPVDSKNSLALGGLGLVYRYAEDYAGLIAMEMFTVDLSTILDPGME